MPAEAFRYDWFAAKSMDGRPLGPGITPAFQVPTAELRLGVGERGLQQEQSTADIVRTVAS